MMNRALGTFAALALLSTSANADEPKPWSADLGVGNVWLGSGARPTGGVSIVLGARRGWELGDNALFDVTVSGEAFGFAGGSHWMGVLVGPGVGATWKTPVDGLTAGLNASLAYGRVPACADWGLCMRFWGLFPGGSLRVAYGNSTFGGVGVLTVRYVDTLVSRTASAGLIGGGFVRW